MLRGLRRVGSTEVVIGVAVVLVAAALVNVAPPLASTTSTAAVRAAQLVATGSDFATTVKVRLVVSPGSAGFNNFNLRVTDYDTGALVRASSVQLEFSQPLRPQLGQSMLTLKRQSDGTFAARGGNLAIAGIWEVAAIIENASNSTEVHLQLTTITTPPIVTVTRFCGTPDSLFDPAGERGARAGLHRSRQARTRRVSCHLLHKLERDQRDPHRLGDHRHDAAWRDADDPGEPQARSDRPFRCRRHHSRGTDALRRPRHHGDGRRHRDLRDHHSGIVIRLS